MSNLSQLLIVDRSPTMATFRIYIIRLQTIHQNVSHINQAFSNIYQDFLNNIYMYITRLQNKHKDFSNTYQYFLNIHQDNGIYIGMRQRFTCHSQHCIFSLNSTFCLLLNTSLGIFCSYGDITIVDERLHFWLLNKKVFFYRTMPQDLDFSGFNQKDCHSLDKQGIQCYLLQQPSGKN